MGERPIVGNLPGYYTAKVACWQVAGYTSNAKYQTGENNANHSLSDKK